MVRIIVLSTLFFALGGWTVFAQSPPEKPRAADTLPAVIPLFPLEPAMLFPGVDRPLHIFEARYRAMVADALKGDRIIGMVTLKPGFEAEYAGRPPIYAIGCAGEITSVEELPGGRFNIVLRGLMKFRVTTEDQSRTYRVASVEWLPENFNDTDKAVLRKLRLRIEDLVTRGGDSKIPPDMSDEEMINMIAQYLPMDHAERQALLELRTVLLRAQALIDHLTTSTPRSRI